MFLKGYQREKHKSSREEVNNVTTWKLQQKTLNWTSHLREVNGSTEGWRSQILLPYSWAFQERKLRRCLRGHLSHRTI